MKFVRDVHHLIMFDVSIRLIIHSTNVPCSKHSPHIFIQSNYFSIENYNGDGLNKIIVDCINMFPLKLNYFVCRSFMKCVQWDVRQRFLRLFGNNVRVRKHKYFFSLIQLVFLKEV